VFTVTASIKLKKFSLTDTRILTLLGQLLISHWSLLKARQSLKNQSSYHVEIFYGIDLFDKNLGRNWLLPAISKVFGFSINS
jgi:hypothetical protein